MGSNLNQIFKNISELEPPKGLDRAIFKRIEEEKEKRIRRNLFLSYMGLIGSFLTTIWAVLAIGSSFLKSEFWSITFLAFSDFIVVAGNWKEYLFSLGETLPIVDIMAILIPIFGMLMFINLLISIKNNRHIGKNINVQAFQH